MDKAHMNIGFIYTAFGSDHGSFGSHGHYLASGLIARGHRLLIPGHPGGNGIVQARHGKLGKLALAWNADILYIRPGFLGWEERTTLLKLVNPRLRVIWELNAPPEERLAWSFTPKDLALVERDKRRKRRLARLVDGCICVSDVMASYARDTLGIKNTHSIPNGADPRAFEDLDGEGSVLSQFRDKFVALWAGDPRYPWQGVDVILEAAKLTEKTRPDILYVLICGSRHAVTMPARRNVLALAGMSPRDVRRLILEADCALVTYNDYGWCPLGFYGSSLKLFEAMASGRPLIASSCGGQMNEIVADGENGLLVPPENPGALVEAVVRLAENPGLGQQLAEAARRKVKERYTWDHTLDAVDQVLQNVCAPRRERIAVAATGSSGLAKS